MGDAQVGLEQGVGPGPPFDDAHHMLAGPMDEPTGSVEDAQRRVFGRALTQDPSRSSSCWVRDGSHTCSMPMAWPMAAVTWGSSGR